MTRFVPTLKLHIVPCELAEANKFITKHHRHHRPPQGHRFSIAVDGNDGVVRGVAVIGRPVARLNQDGGWVDWEIDPSQVMQSNGQYVTWELVLVAQVDEENAAFLRQQERDTAARIQNPEGQ